MKETLSTRVLRYAFNIFPAYFGTGARVTYISGDWREVKVALPLSVRTRNYVGTIFGGSMFGAVDPFYMIMLIRNLGPNYLVWDKAATIRFLKPGRRTLEAAFRIDQAEIDAIRAGLASERSVERIYTIRLVDTEGLVCAEVVKTVHVRRKDGNHNVAPKRRARG